MTVTVLRWCFEYRPPLRDRIDAYFRRRDPLTPVVERRELEPTGEVRR